MASVPPFVFERMEKRFYTMLLVVFWSILIGCGLLYAVFSVLGMIGFLSDLPPKTVMIWSYVLMMATLLAIPLVLKNVKQQQKRITLLGAVLETNTFSYILLGDKSIGYLVLITLVAMIFVYPKKELTDEDQDAMEDMERQNGTTFDE